MPIAGEPSQRLEPGSRITRVAVLGDDFPGLKPRLRVREGDRVQRGQVLFEDRRAPGVAHTAPAAGKVIGVHRGARRVLQSVVIHLSESEREGEGAGGEAVRFTTFTGDDPSGLERPAVAALLQESGLWTAFRTRPFSQVPPAEGTPEAIFVTAIDTQPLAPDPGVVIGEARSDFMAGLSMVQRLSGGATYLCAAPGFEPGPDLPAGVSVHWFAGPHPAGLAGTHIHFLHPAARDHVVWWIGYQDVIAVGRLFRTGALDPARIVSMAGPPVLRPRLLRTRLGACLDDLVAEENLGSDVRLISGSVLSGKRSPAGPFNYLGRYHNQVSVLDERVPREFLGWLKPGSDSFSATPAFLSALRPGRRYPFSTALRGGQRAMLPVDAYERVMPLDVLPTFLLRAMLVADLERAEELGCLELDEEDLSLCTFVCPSKIDYGPVLRHNLELIQAEAT